MMRLAQPLQPSARSAFLSIRRRPAQGEQCRVWSLLGIRRRRHGAIPCILAEYAKGVDAGRGAGVAAGHSLKFRFAEEAWFNQLFVAISLSRHGAAPFFLSSAAHRSYVAPNVRRVPPIPAHAFRGRVDIGDGELHRVAAETIRAYKLFDAPDLAAGTAGRTSTYR